jgi:hypothetical protein
MAQAFRHLSLSAEARVRARVSSCGICGGQSGTGTGFALSSFAFPCQYHSIVALRSQDSNLTIYISQAYMDRLNMRDHAPISRLILQSVTLSCPALHRLSTNACLFGYDMIHFRNVLTF